MGALSEVLLTRSNIEILAIIGAYRDRRYLIYSRSF